VIELLNTIPERPEVSFFKNVEAAKKFDRAIETLKPKEQKPLTEAQ
jgi:hypothetical protein